MDNKTRKKWNDHPKWLRVATYVSLGILVLMILVSAIAGGGKTEEQKKAPETATIPYELVEEKDISHQYCKRVTYKIKVADDANKDAVEATEQKIINDNKSNWEDITVWTYKNSDTNEFIKNNGFTVDMAEYSTCQ